MRRKYNTRDQVQCIIARDRLMEGPCKLYQVGYKFRSNGVNSYFVFKWSEEYQEWYVCDLVEIKERSK